MTARYDQCDDTCTVDCGHCKGQGRPAPDPILALCDRLEQARAAATPGEWRVGKGNEIEAGQYDTVIERGPVDCMSYCYGGTSTIEGDNLPADAALIVAAVNAVPEMVAAIRAVHALADEWLRDGSAPQQAIDLRRALAAVATDRSGR